MKLPFGKIIAAMLVIGSVAAMPACSPATAENGKPTVVATIFPYYDIVRSVGGDKINAQVLVRPGMEVHDFKASIRDEGSIKAAKLVVKNGLGMDDWNVLGKGSGTILDIGAGVGTAMGAATAPAAGVVNPHIWLDPVKQIKATELVRDALIGIDPANKATYEANAAKYIEDLKKLDADYAAAVKSFSKKAFIGYHDAYAYLAARYGLEQVASLDAHHGGITPATMEATKKLLAEKKATVLFAEDEESRRKIADIVKETGATTGVLLPLEGYADPKQTYVELMRENLDVLKQALK